MRQWFPFTDYDFYGYLISGATLIAAINASVFDGSFLRTENWNFVEAAFWVAMAYVVGHVLAAPSSALLEHLVARRWLSSCLEIQLRLLERNWFERLLAYVFAPREYAPLPELTVVRIRANAREALALNPSDEIDAQSLYFSCFSKARGQSDTAVRLDQFLNLYGFCRNMSFAALVSAILLTAAPPQISGSPMFGEPSYVLAIGAIIISIGMFGRFFKFYAAYSSEVCRSMITKG